MDDVIFSGHLVGTFYGYRGGNVYRLSDGSKWVQDDGTDEPAFTSSNVSGDVSWIRSASDTY